MPSTRALVFRCCGMIFDTVVVATCMCALHGGIGRLADLVLAVCVDVDMLQVVRLGLNDPSAVVQGVLALMSKLPVDQRESVVAALRRGVIFADPLSSGHGSVSVVMMG